MDVCTGARLWRRCFSELTEGEHEGSHNSTVFQHIASSGPAVAGNRTGDPACAPERQDGSPALAPTPHITTPGASSEPVVNEYRTGVLRA